MRLDVLDDFVMTDDGVEFDEGRDGAGVHHCILDVGAGERPDCIHGLPAGKHREFQLTVELPPAEVCAGKSRHASQLRYDFFSKMLRIGFCGGRLRPAPPFANDHAASPSRDVMELL